MKKIAFALVAVLALAVPTVPAMAQVNPVWTAAASTGDIDESAQSIFAVNGTALAYLPGSPSLSSIVARYNVTNLDGAVNPNWNTLELGYFDNSPSGSVRATLFQADCCSGSTIALCTVTSSDFTTNTCGRCVFSVPMDFTRNVYWVEVTLSRTASTVLPQALAVRIYHP